MSVESKAIAARLAAACKAEMHADEAMADASLKRSAEEPLHGANKKPFKPAKHVHGKVLQAHWEPSDYEAIQEKLQCSTKAPSEATSDKAINWKCAEWQMSKTNMVSFRSISYHFQTLAFLAANRDVQLQNNMSVIAWPCENPLCVTADHLFLQGARRRGRPNANLPPFDCIGMQHVHDSEAKLRRAKQDAHQADDSMTATISIRDLLNMNAEQQRAYFCTSA